MYVEFLAHSHSIAIVRRVSEDDPEVPNAYTWSVECLRQVLEPSSHGVDSLTQDSPLCQWKREYKCGRQVRVGQYWEAATRLLSRVQHRFSLY